MNSEPDKGAPMSKHIQVLIAVLAVLLLPSAIAGQLKEKHCSDYPYGLYYGSWTNKDSDLAFVISRGGKPIPQKANDPDAPTQPGFLRRGSSLRVCVVQAI